MLIVTGWSAPILDSPSFKMRSVAALTSEKWRSYFVKIG